MRISRRRLFLGSAARPALGAVTPAQGAVGRRFTGEALRAIAFPLGGIGTGTVSLGGFGNLRDWEIFNRRNKGSMVPFTFGALRITAGGKTTARILERELMPPYNESHGL